MKRNALLSACAALLVAVSPTEAKPSYSQGVVKDGNHHVAVPNGWTTFRSGTLTFTAPVGTIAAPENGVDSYGWFIHAPKFYVKVSLGCCIGNYHDQDGRPDCFVAEKIYIDHVPAIMWTGKGYPKLDCPELNAQLYAERQPEDRHDQRESLWVLMYGDSQDELALVKLMVSTFHFSRW